MTTVTLSPTEGGQCIRQNEPNTVRADIMQVGEEQGNTPLSRGLVTFDLSSIPGGSTITTATLKLYDDGANLSTNTRTMRVYRLLRNWTTSATWNKYDGTNNWGTAGASNTATDRESSDIGSVSMPATEVVGYVDITLTASSIKEMLNGGTFTNNGFLIQMDTELNDMHSFTPGSGANGARLEIVYSEPSGFLVFM